MRAKISRLTSSIEIPLGSMTPIQYIIIWLLLLTITPHVDGSIFDDHQLHARDGFKLSINSRQDMSTSSSTSTSPSFTNQQYQEQYNNNHVINDTKDTCIQTIENCKVYTNKSECSECNDGYFVLSKDDYSTDARCDAF